MVYIILAILAFIIGFILGVMRQDKESETATKLNDAYNKIKDVAIKRKK